MEKENYIVPDSIAGENETDFAEEILTYCRMNLSGIIWTAVISLIGVCLVFAILYCWMPRQKTYKLNHQITLKEEGNSLQYPSKRIFKPEDIVSPLVLEQVYKNLNLQKYMKYADFSSMVSVMKDEREKMKLNAQYSKKFKMKNLKLDEINRLEQEYMTALLKYNFDKNVTLILRPKYTMIPEKNASQILYAISNTWFKIYLKLETKPFPQMESAESVKKKKNEANQGNYLISLEKARGLTNDLLLICSDLETLIQKKKIHLPSGEYLSDLEDQIRFMQRYQLNVYLHYITLHPELCSSFDRGVLYTSLEQVEKDLLYKNSARESIISSLNFVFSNSNAGAASLDSSTKQGGITLQLDSGFFNSFATLVRNDMNMELREKSAKKIFELQKSAAKLEMEKKYYMNLLGKIDNSKQSGVAQTISISEKQLKSLICNMYDELIQINNKIMQFRDLVMNNYLSNDLFYTVDSSVSIQRNFIVPVKIQIAILAVLWVLGNIICIFAGYMSGKSRNTEADKRA